MISVGLGLIILAKGKYETPFPFLSLSLLSVLLCPSITAPQWDAATRLYSNTSIQLTGLIQSQRKFLHSSELGVIFPE